MILVILYNDIQPQVIRREFESVGPILFKGSHGACGLLLTLWWGGLLDFSSSREKISQPRIERQPSARIWIPLHCHLVV